MAGRLLFLYVYPRLLPRVVAIVLLGDYVVKIAES
jgi:hypothetical protein